MTRHHPIPSYTMMRMTNTSTAPIAPAASAPSSTSRIGKARRNSDHMLLRDYMPLALRQEQQHRRLASALAKADRPTPDHNRSVDGNGQPPMKINPMKTIPPGPSSSIPSSLHLIPTPPPSPSPVSRAIRARRVSLGRTLQEIADAIGVSRGYLSMIETGQRSLPGDDILHKLEHALQLDTGELVRRAQLLATPSTIRAHLEAVEHGRQKAVDLTRRLLNMGNDLDAMLKSGELHRLLSEELPNIESPVPMIRRVPVINKVAAGYPTHFTDLDYPARVADEYLTIPADAMATLDPGDDQPFAARVIGDSMEPEYHEGDIVVFSPQSPTPDGCDCFIRFERDAETTFKRIHFEGQDRNRIRLQPLNEGKYPCKVFDREEIAGMYAAVYVMRKITPTPMRKKEPRTK